MKYLECGWDVKAEIFATVKMLTHFPKSMGAYVMVSNTVYREILKYLSPYENP